MDLNFTLFIVAVFIAMILLVEGIYVRWSASRGPEARRIARRLQTMSGAPEQAAVSIRKRRDLAESPRMQRLLARLPLVARLDNMLAQSGSQKNLAQFLAVSAGLALAGACLGLLLPVPAALSLLPAGLLGLSPWAWFERKRSRRLATLEAQLPDALDLMSRALRAGHALPAAIQMVTTEMNDPVAGEFRIVFDEINYGIPMHDALTNMAARVPGTDVGYFVVAVLIQRETGGDLTELLRNIASIVRERLKLMGQVRALSAEGRLSAWILTIMPFALTALMNSMNPKFMHVLWTEPKGQKIVGGMLVLMLFGIVWMRKIIRIRV